MGVQDKKVGSGGEEGRVWWEWGRGSESRVENGDQWVDGKQGREG